QDHRGDVFNDDYNCAMFMTYTTPNSTVPDQLAGYCVYPYQTNPPCTGGSPPFNAARSYHAGGVNTLMADGSVKFTTDPIPPAATRHTQRPHGPAPPPPRPRSCPPAGGRAPPPPPLLGSLPRTPVSSETPGSRAPPAAEPPQKPGFRKTPGFSHTPHRNPRP